MYQGGQAHACSAAYERYQVVRHQVRTLLADNVLNVLHRRVEVRPIGSVELSTVRSRWQPSRPASWPRDEHWSWDDVMCKLHTFGPRTLDIALYAGYPNEPMLCGLAVAKVSPRKRWLSLTHMEGAPFDHPLKGLVLPLVMSSLGLFKVLCVSETEAGNDGQEFKKMGIRVLNPLPSALPYYERQGYTEHIQERRLSYIVVDPAS